MQVNELVILRSEDWIDNWNTWHMYMSIRQDEYRYSGVFTFHRSVFLINRLVVTNTINSKELFTQTVMLAGKHSLRCPASCMPITIPSPRPALLRFLHWNCLQRYCHQCHENGFHSLHTGTNLCRVAQQACMSTYCFCKLFFLQPHFTSSTTDEYAGDPFIHSTSSAG